MYSIKLVINTGIHWYDVVDLGLTPLAFSTLLQMGLPDIDRQPAGDIVPALVILVDDLGSHPDKYKRYDVQDILDAREYLSKLLAACKYHPGCEVRVETI